MKKSAIISHIFDGAECLLSLGLLVFLVFRQLLPSQQLHLCVDVGL